MDISKTLMISAAGLRVQSSRMRVLAENIANSGSTALTPDGEPYWRKLVSFENVLDRELGLPLVQIKRFGFDQSDYGRRFEPGHPAAADEGYVKTANVKSIIEMTDMREVLRSYEANLNVIEMSKTMMQQTIDLLRV